MEQQKREGELAFQQGQPRPKAAEQGFEIANIGNQNFYFAKNHSFQHKSLEVWIEALPLQQDFPCYLRPGSISRLVENRLQ